MPVSPLLALQSQQEDVYRKLLTQGLSTYDIAKRLGISQQSAYRFIARRGWQTARSASDAELTAVAMELAEAGASIAQIARQIGRTDQFVESILKR